MTFQSNKTEFFMLGSNQILKINKLLILVEKLKLRKKSRQTAENKQTFDFYDFYMPHLHIIYLYF